MSLCVALKGRVMEICSFWHHKPSPIIILCIYLFSIISSIRNSWSKFGPRNFEYYKLSWGEENEIKMKDVAFFMCIFAPEI